MTASVNKITSKSRANSPQGICNPRTIMRWFVFPFLCVPKHLGPEVVKAMYDPACALRALGLLLADVPSQWGGGRLFDKLNGLVFTETAITRERKVEKSFPRWEMNGLPEGYKRAFDQNWCRMAKIGFLAKT